MHAHHISITSSLPELSLCLIVSEVFTLYPEDKKVNLQNDICKTYADYQHDHLILATPLTTVLSFVSFIPNYSQVTL